MKQGEAPWFLMWCSALLFAFGMVWAWLADIGAAITAVLDLRLRSTLLIGAGVLGILLGQSGALLAWRRYVRAMEHAAACRTASGITGRASRATSSATTGQARDPEAASSS